MLKYNNNIYTNYDDHYNYNKINSINSIKFLTVLQVNKSLILWPCNKVNNEYVDLMIYSFVYVILMMFYL